MTIPLRALQRGLHWSIGLRKCKTPGKDGGLQIHSEWKEVPMGLLMLFVFLLLRKRRIKLKFEIEL
jgi:hypothetical protein